jgi:hypothetical protein
MAPVENYSGRNRRRLTRSRSARVLAWSVCLAIATFSGLVVAGSGEPFRFESIVDLGDMRQLIEQRFQPGSPRAVLRATFVTEGKGTLKIHPSQAGVEKYIYDINLCRYYIWRWNISADYDAGGHLIQAYVNGDPVFPGGRQKKDGRALGASSRSVGSTGASPGLDFRRFRSSGFWLNSPEKGVRLRRDENGLTPL